MGAMAATVAVTANAAVAGGCSSSRRNTTSQKKAMGCRGGGSVGARFVRRGAGMTARAAENAAAEMVAENGTSEDENDIPR